MRLAHDLFAFPAVLVLALCALALASVIGLQLVASKLRERAVTRFGDEALVMALQTHRAGGRRAIKGVLIALGFVAVFASFARPQLRSGTRLVPATSLDVAIVVDYSKSMYARDIAPNRITRAKLEIAQLVRDLQGARFGAVAYAGEPLSFPLTADGAAIAQFFRQLDPNDMPVGGTATARALVQGKELLMRDPNSKTHAKVILLVTDGEDTEGDPTTVSQSCKDDGITIHVVQIGGRLPEPIPDVGPDGKVRGSRVDEKGRILTTALSADGETQLETIATRTGGMRVKAERGQTGIVEVQKRLRTLMKSELSERSESVYDEAYGIPLGVGIFLLVLEALIFETPRRKKVTSQVAKAITLTTLFLFAACGWDPRRPFEREAPEVRTAVKKIDAGAGDEATALLTEYLGTGACAKGEIGAPEFLRARPQATFDLGLALFQLSERYGGPLDKLDAPADPSKQEKKPAPPELACAVKVLTLIAGDATLDPELRHKVHFLLGNLALLAGKFDDAIAAYDTSLLLAAARVDAGESVARDAAHNRAIALRRKEQEPPPPDAGNDGGGDGGDDGGDGGNDDGGDGGGGDAGVDAGSPPPPLAQASATPKGHELEVLLDELENAPTLQQESGKRRAGKRRIAPGLDK